MNLSQFKKGIEIQEKIEELEMMLKKFNECNGVGIYHHQAKDGESETQISYYNWDEKSNESTLNLKRQIKPLNKEIAECFEKARKDAMILINIEIDECKQQFEKL